MASGCVTSEFGAVCVAGRLPGAQQANRLGSLLRQAFFNRL
jgi:hypothetical protein